jgi:hypothetical protein
MKQIKEEQSPPCGYGLLGLCCSACLLGPCRISPFEKESRKGLCGDSADLTVAKNLLRVAGGEALLGLASLKEAAERLGASKGGRSVDQEKALIDKYGLRSTFKRKGFRTTFLKEIEKLLSPFSEDRSPLLKTLFPEKSFPYLYRDSSPPGSLIGFFLDSMKNGLTESSDIKKILDQCLSVSALHLVCEEMRQDLDGVMKGEGFSPPDSTAPHSSPVILLLSDEKSSSREWIQRMTQELGALFKGKVLILSLKGIGTLPDTGRRLSKESSLPVAEMKILALISSPYLTWTLGALALGFTVISSPALPIHGSEKVEKFFSEDLQKKFGNTYFPSWKEDLLDSARAYLKWKE